MNELYLTPCKPCPIHRTAGSRESCNTLLSSKVWMVGRAVTTLMFSELWAQRSEAVRNHSLLAGSLNYKRSSIS